MWSKEELKAREVRALAYKSNKSHETYKSYLQNPEDFANTLVCLIHQANYLLDQQMKALEQAFLKEGGFTERLYNMRKQNR
ncbi:MAG TPA: four helix bundle suffix domain-containing protein [Candidatus Paceibacterota bacterium]